MKYLVLFIALFQTASLFALPANCVLVDGQNASDMLTACGAGTVGVDTLANSNDQEWVKDRIIAIATAAISLGALLAVGAIVWAGIQYTKSMGDDEKLKKAKSSIIFALIGLILLMAAFPLVDIVINFVYKIAGQ